MLQVYGRKYAGNGIRSGVLPRGYLCFFKKIVPGKMGSIRPAGKTEEVLRVNTPFPGLPYNR